MSTTDQQLRELLLRCQSPPPAGAGPDWQDVVARANASASGKSRARRHGSMRATSWLVPVLAAAAILAVIAWHGTGWLNPSSPSSSGPTSPIAAHSSQAAIDPATLILKRNLIVGADRSNPAKHLYVLQELVPAGMSAAEDVAASWQAAVDAIAITYAHHPPRAHVYAIGQSTTPADLHSKTKWSESVSYDGTFKPASVTEARHAALRAAGRLGLTINALRVSRNGGEAVVQLTATPTASNLVQYVHHHLSPAAELGIAGAATFVQLLDHHHKVIVADGAGGRDQAGFTWWAPGYRPKCLSFHVTAGCP